MDERALLAALRTAFAADLVEQVRALEGGLVAMERAGAEARPELLRDLFRAAHGLKGAARAAGVGPVERACHGMESLLGAARDEGRALAREDFAALLAGVDALGGAQRALAEGREPDAAALEAVVERVEGRLRAATAAGTSTPAAAPSPPPPTAPAAARRALRLAPERLDALAATGGTLALAAQSAEARAARADELLADLRKARAQLRAGRSAADGLQRVERGLAALRAQLFAEGRALGQRTRRLVDEVRGLRLTPWVEATAGLDRIARDVAEARGKEVELEVEGETLELDKSVVDALREPLAHLVRNAVDHGVEPPPERRAAGKPERGRVRLAAWVDGERARVRVEDDGRGLDPARLVAAARRRGVAPPPDPARALELVFVAGLSTVDEPNDVSGRGVGLDAVAAAVRALRGEIAVSSAPGRGAVFEIALPATLYGVRAVLARDGGQVVAIPSLDVARVERLAPARMRTSGGRTVLLGEEPLALAPLAQALGAEAGAWDAGRRRLALVLAAGGRRAAFAVEDVLAERELSLEPLPPRLRAQALATGVAVLSTGELAVVLSAHALVEAALGARAPSAPAAAAGAAPRRRRVLLADDAATTRTLGRSILEASGWEVLAAADGEQAWALLRQHGADAVVTDVEMPGLDGFELTRAIRSSPRFARLPVVLLTGLASEADRRRGLEAGADAYLVKSAFDQRVLLETLDHLTEEP